MLAVARAWLHRYLVPPREQRHVDRGVVGKDPSLEHDLAWTGYFEAIAVRCRRTRLGSELTVRAVEFYEFPHIREQWRLFCHSMT
jgi:hypothetical protein